MNDMTGVRNDVHRNGSLKMYVLVGVLSAVITATGSVLANNWCRIFPCRDIATEKAAGTEPRPTPDTSLVGSFGSFSKFGKWITLKKDVTYQAQSDGFIAAYTGGKSPANGVLIYVGERIDELSVRTRTGRYDGAVCPVSKGDYWMVKSNNGGSITVHWLPVSNSRNNG